MDIDLLSKMVKEVVMDHDVVTLPGVGSFVAELVPANFADRGYTIMPPYRRLSFSPKQGDDTILVTLYAQSNGISEADANRILTDFLAEMKEVLKVKKTIIFPGLGRLRATMENHIFFVADEDLEIYPSGFGLQPISLKTHEETKEEVAQAVSSLATLLEKQNVPEPVKEPDVVIPSEASESPKEGDTLGPKDLGMTKSEPEPVKEPEPEPVKEPEEEYVYNYQKRKKGWKGFWVFILVLVIIALTLAIALVAVGYFFPEWLDSFLYTPEEYQIIHN